MNRIEFIEDLKNQIYFPINCNDNEQDDNINKSYFYAQKRFNKNILLRLPNESIDRCNCSRCSSKDSRMY